MLPLTKKEENKNVLYESEKCFCRSRQSQKLVFHMVIYECDCFDSKIQKDPTKEQEISSAKSSRKLF